MEDDQFMMDFLSRTFLNGNPHENFQSIELTYGPSCNLSCDYCYLDKYGDKLYPVCSKQRELDNTRLVMEWLNDLDVHPNIEIFSGEPMIQPVMLEAIREVIDFHPRQVVIPTNYTFINGKEQPVRELLEYAKQQGVKVSLSASFDGKYMESNRPSKVPMVRDDAYYDKCFQFNKDYGFGFHPMVYSKGIENWQQNFLWFQSKFEEFSLPWQNIYLLEVRNANWTYNQIKEYGKFIEFLIKWTHNHTDMVKFLLKDGYNILKSPLTTVGRGLGCSIQGTLFIRMSDLSIIPCHRLSYPPFIYGKLAVDGGYITGIEAKNITMMNGIYSFTAHSQPYCSRCSIAPLCSFGCLGSQFETNGDIFTPIPTVCALYQMKMETMARVLDDIGVLDGILPLIRDDKAETLHRLRRQHGR